MPLQPSRRRFLTALGVGTAGIAGLEASYSGTVTVPHLSPVWERWHVQAGGRSQTVGREMVLVADRLILTADDAVLALDPETGDYLWNRPVSSRAFHGVGVGDSTVYAGDHDFVAISLDGTERWRIDLDDVDPSDPDSTNLDCTPVVAGGRVFLSTRTHLLALDATNGTAVWSTPLDGWTVEALELTDESLIVGLGNRNANHGRLLAFDCRDGSRTWETRVSDRRIDLAVGDLLYCAVGRVAGAGGTGVVAFDFDGTRRWTYDLIHVNGVTVHDGIVYAVAGVGDYDDVFEPRAPKGSLVALDAATGAERWRIPAESYGRVAPAVTDDRVYVSSSVTGGPGRSRAEGAVLAYTTDGEHRWTYPVGEDNQPITSPVVHDGTILVGGDRSIVALAEREW